MINGLPGINNGSIDPINVDNIEVIKGPSEPYLEVAYYLMED